MKSEPNEIKCFRNSDALSQFTMNETFRSTVRKATQEGIIEI